MAISVAEYHAVLQTAIRDWAAVGFPQAWPLLDFSDEPTRFVPVRLLTDNRLPTNEGPSILLNGFPASACGKEYFQLLATLGAPSTPEIPLFSLSWEVLQSGKDKVPLFTELLDAKPIDPLPDIADWLLDQLRSACDHTNRKIIPTRRTLAPRH